MNCSWPRRTGAFLVAFLLAAAAAEVATDAGAQVRPRAKEFYDRNEIPGTYTIGLYPKEDASGARELSLGSKEETFNLFLGITGDSTRTFSGMAFSVDLPEGVSLDGPVRWRSIPHLKQKGSLADRGTEIEFSAQCQMQAGANPLVLGRLQFRVDPSFRGGEIVVRDHFQFGCSVELCVDGWPKPYATGLATTIERSRSFWDKIRDVFR